MKLERLHGMRLGLVLVFAGCYTRPIAPAPPTPVVPVAHVAPRSALVFVSGRDSENHWSAPQIYLIDTRHLKPVNLTNDANSNSAPSFSPDGRKMLYVSNGARLRVMDLQTKAMHELSTSTVGQLQAPRWSPLHAIAYEAPAYAPRTAVWLAGEDGSASQRLTNPAQTESDDGGLAFIDGGKRIVFSRYDFTTHDRDLYVVDTDGSGKTRRITESLHETETEPVASHDGRLLAFRVTGNGSVESIRILAVRDWSLVRDIPLPAPAQNNISGIDFTADDRGLVFGADATDVGGSLQNLHGEIFTMAIDGSHSKRITKDASYDGQPVVLPTYARPAANIAN